MSSFRLLFDAGPREFAMMVGLQLAAGAAAGLQLLAVKHLIDAVLVGNRHGSLGAAVPWLAALAVLALIVSIATAIQAERQRLLAELLNRHTALNIFQAAAAADLPTFEDPAFHDRLERAWTTGAGRPLQMTQAIMSLLSAAAAAAGVMAALSALVPVLVPLIALGAALVAVATVPSSRAFYQFATRATPLDRRRSYVSRILVLREHQHEVIAYGLHGFLQRIWRSLHDERLMELRRIIRARLVITLSVSVANALLFILPIAVLGLMVLLGLDVSRAVAAAAGVLLLRPAMQAAAGGGAQLYESALFLDDYARFVREGSRPIPMTAPAPLPRSFGLLTVDHVTFVYPNAHVPALRNVSLEIEAGQLIALVGENGSGKTTLVKLLLGLYQPTSGRISWDGEDIAAFDLDMLRQNVAVLFQDFGRYSLTLSENVALGKPERAADAHAIAQACGRADANGFVAELPQRYDTWLGPEFEGGHNLSVGQWQRIALARAFLRDAPFVILDEPTASLDPRAEREVFDSMRKLFEGRTVLLISHRFASARVADRIFVLERGSVVEEGSHRQLVTAGGLYAELYRMQSEGHCEDVVRPTPA